LRTRTEARRLAIIEAARSVFLEHGFERASMSQISERLGGSKATLYGYFKSKEELFLATVEQGIEVESGELIAAIRRIPDTRKALETFGRSYVEKATGARPIAVYRMIANLPADSGVGLTFYERGLRQGWIMFCLYVEDLIAAGQLRPCTAWVAAMHLKGMLEGEFVERRLLNALPRELDRQTIERVARDAVDAFLRAYGPEA